jgi:hypothetical protein
MLDFCDFRSTQNEKWVNYVAKLRPGGSLLPWDAFLQQELDCTSLYLLLVLLLLFASASDGAQL